MGLFSKDKEHEDLKQTQDIKSATTSIPELNSNPTNTQNQTTNQPNKQNFVNPFSNPPNTNQNQTTNQTTQNQPQQTINQNIPPIDELSPTNQPQQTTDQNSIFNIDQNPQPNSKLPSDQTTQNQPQQTITSNQQPEKFTKEQIQEMVDETVEQVIEERWKGIIQKIEKVAAWKDKQEQHINLIKEDILTIKDNFEKLEKRIIDKVSSYDKNILDVNSEIKALEKVFQKITPTLVNNVNELSKIAKTFKDDSETENLD